MMDTISRYLGADHTRCDALFEELEASVSATEWQQAETRFACFHQALERHFGMEEGVLFPAFEQAIGSSAGPTGVMRMEHQHVRGIVSRVSYAVEQRDANDFFDHADTLRIMVQQHNLKEESILYGMVDRALSGRQGQIIDAMATIAPLNVGNAIE